MGCLKSKPHSSKLQETDEQPKQYSWDVRKKVDPKDYTIENIKGQTVGRLPGTLNGMQFIIQNCEDTNIFIFDHTGQVTVDDCVNCNVFIGPVKGSVFIRDCKSCKFMFACQQFRTRDCQKIESFLCCVSQPIIEASTGMKFGCFEYNYPELSNQFEAAGLSVYNNNWSNIHDFTPVPDQNNYSLISEDENVKDHFPLPTTEEFSCMQISLPETSHVPLSRGKRRKVSQQGCLVVFFFDSNVHERTKIFLKHIKEQYKDSVLVQSKEIVIQSGDAQRVFGSENYMTAVNQGPVIALEFNGEGCTQACQNTLSNLGLDSTGLAFVSSSPESAQEQIDNFFTFADLQMNA